MGPPRSLSSAVWVASVSGEIIIIIKKKTKTKTFIAKPIRRKGGSKPIVNFIHTYTYIYIYMDSRNQLSHTRVPFINTLNSKLARAATAFAVWRPVESLSFHGFFSSPSLRVSLPLSTVFQCFSLSLSLSSVFLFIELMIRQLRNRSPKCSSVMYSSLIIVIIIYPFSGVRRCYY